MYWERERDEVKNLEKSWKCISSTEQREMGERERIIK